MSEYLRILNTHDPPSTVSALQCARASRNGGVASGYQYGIPPLCLPAVRRAILVAVEEPGEPLVRARRALRGAQRGPYFESAVESQKNDFLSCSAARSGARRRLRGGEL